MKIGIANISYGQTICPTLVQAWHSGAVKRAFMWHALPVGLVLFSSCFGPQWLQTGAYVMSLLVLPLVAGIFHRSLWVGLFAASLAIVAVFLPFFAFLALVLLRGAE